MAHDHRDDPEVRHLAAQQGVSLDVAVERIRWQTEAFRLRDWLTDTMSHTYMALLVDQEDGDRLKLHLRNPSEDDLAAIRTQLASRDVLGATDVVLTSPE